ncbi:hypothetical protein K505DRAFT_304567 [Melanomma pulvis-pyrius CBS 109.77]|uniref:Apple domain-containing protein n=1 Tax=Melanomma pulvis-pyrius CBS 109.77 TaxID=1314802 RepID=A0A6A6XCU2_9PLEO|nr:hypothetical protein K505DRAFT_304567 [Melanomma pulvis-pyrius CBS 109.77]
MKASIIVAAALVASVNGAVIEARQRRTSTRAPIGGTPDVSECGLDAFVGHTAEALLFCSSMLKGGTATQTITSTNRETLTSKTTVWTTLYPPSAAPTTTVRPPTTTVKPPPSSTPKPPSSTVPVPPSSTIPSPSPTPTAAGCGIVGYTKTVAAYYFDSTGTKNTWTACSAACKADAKCKSFGYGEANCMLFDVTAADNTNYNPMSPYTFYDASCPKELPVKKRQVNISLGLPGGPPAISSACSCLITSGTPDKITTTTVTSSQKTTTTQTVTRTVSLLPENGRR